MSRSIRRSYELSDLVLFHSISLHIYEFYIWGNITLFLSAQLLHSELECSREIPDLYALFKRAVKLKLMAKLGVESLD